MKQLIYPISIRASKEKVWKTMLSPDTYSKWTAASWPGSFYEGNWQEGEKIRFIAANGSGTLVLITQLQPYEYIAAEHIAILLPGGIEDKSSKSAKEWIGTKENYRFTETGDAVLLQVEIIINPVWEQVFNDGWPNALLSLKNICEGNDKN